MHLIILSERPHLYSVQRLLKEGKVLGAICSQINPYHSHLPTYEKDLTNTLVLHRCSGYRFDDFDLNYSLHLKTHKAKVVNDPLSLLRLRDKELQTSFFKEQKLPYIPTFSFRGKPPKEEIEKFLNGSEKIILKSNRGSSGIGTILIEGKDSLFSLLETFWAMKDQRFLLQPYIESHEYRLFYSTQGLIGALEKENNPGSFKKNFKQGAKAIALSSSDIPLDVKDVGDRAFKLSGLSYSGIDILKIDNEVFILEINTVPGFEQLEQLTGLNVAKIILSI